MSRRRGQTRSSSEYPRTRYYCTGGAGAAVQSSPTGLTWLPDGGHVPVGNLERVGVCDLRCPVCGLTKPVNYERRQLIDRAGLTEVDISDLPF